MWISFNCKDNFDSKKSFYHNKTVAYKVDKWKSLEIDDIEDFNLAKYYIKAKKMLLQIK